MTQEKKQERVVWIDVARGLGILLVVLGHTLTTPVRNANHGLFALYSAIYFFHMPFLFYLSGCTFRLLWKRNIQYSFGKWCKKKCNTLLLPYVTYGIVVYLIFALANAIPVCHRILEPEGYGLQAVSTWMRQMITVQGKDLYSYHLWFIYALFIMNIFSFLVGKYSKYDKQLLLFLGILFMGIRVCVIQVNDWGIINLVMKCYFWFVLGSYFDVSKFIEKWYGKVWAIFSVVYVAYYVTHEGIFGQTWVYLKYMYPLPMEIIKWIMDVGLIVACIWSSTVVAGYVKRFLEYTGKQSFGIYLFHQPFFASGFGMVLFQVLHLPLYITIPLTFVLCYAIPLGIVWILHTRYFSVFAPFFFGFREKRNS